MMMGQLDIHVQTNETEPWCHTAYKLEKTKAKAWNKTV